MATVSTQFGTVSAGAIVSDAATVCTCYSLLDVAPLCGVSDFTDGKYVDDGNDRAAYLAAQRCQADYLLDQVGCRAGTRLLDIGCGYGRVLEQAAARGAKPIGITISPEQVASCKARGLDVRQASYRHLSVDDAQWQAAFNAVIANGSLEHFVQASDASAGRADAIYEEFFAICRRLLSQRLLTREGRLVTTAIHFRRRDQIDPRMVLSGSAALPRGSDAYQFALLSETFGGWYPEPGQLARCAEPNFELIAEEDGTEDYRRTSEFWLRRLQVGAAFNPRVWWAIAGHARRHPKETWKMLRSHLWDQTWYWQFRQPAPMRLLRQTWLAK